MKAFENELMLGIEKRKNHFFFEDYKYCIKELINLYHVNDINKFNFLEKYIDKLPLELLDAEYLIYLVYHYSLVYSRNEMIRFNKKNFSKYLNLSSALHN